MTFFVFLRGGLLILGETPRQKTLSRGDEEGPEGSRKWLRGRFAQSSLSSSSETLGSVLCLFHRINCLRRFAAPAIYIKILRSAGASNAARAPTQDSEETTGPG